MEILVLNHGVYKLLGRMQQNQTVKFIMHVAVLHETMCNYQVSLYIQFVERNQNE